MDRNPHKMLAFSQMPLAEATMFKNRTKKSVDYLENLHNF